jgi:general secretion pathway protein J
MKLGPHHARGFTLFELLVAMAVFAILSALAYSGLNAVGQASAVTREQAERLREIQRALVVVERDLAQAVPRPIRDEFGDRVPALLANARDGGLLRLTQAGWANPAGQPRSQLQRVRYDLEGDILRRSYWLDLDRAPGALPVQADLLEGVERIELRWLDSGGAWQGEWPPLRGQNDEAEAMPRAAELLIELSDWGALRRVVVMPG